MGAISDLIPPEEFWRPELPVLPCTCDEDPYDPDPYSPF